MTTSIPRRTVLMLSGNGPPVLDGVGHYTTRLLAQLAAMRPEWRWVWLRRKRRWFTSPLRRERGVRIVQPWHRWDRTGISLAQRAVRWYRPDILHVQEQTHTYHETNAAADVLRVASGVTISTVHEVHPELIGHRGTAALVASSRQVWTNDAVTAEKCQTNMGRTPDAVLWSPANVLPPTWPVARQPTLVVTFGFLSAIKGIETVYHALQRVRETVPGLKWRIVGQFQPQVDPNHARLRDALCGDWIEFTGSREDLDDHTLRTWLAEAAVMALPFVDGSSTRRGTLQTAWAFGLPVVTTPPGTPQETAIQTGINCVTVPLDAEQWAEAITRVLESETTAKRLAYGSRQAGEHHNWERLATEHLRRYDMALSQESRCG